MNYLHLITEAYTVAANPAYAALTGAAQPAGSTPQD